MTDHKKPEFQDILNIINSLPEGKPFQSDSSDSVTWLNDWLTHASRIYDFSRGFEVNRCALYWAGYDETDNFDGQAFVDSCQDGNGSLRKLAQILDTDLQIFELDPHNHTKPDTDALAMAASYGMMGIEESTQLFCTASFGQGVNSTAEQALSALQTTNGNFNLEDFMTAHCGLDHAAMLGCTIAAIMKGIPMILEGASGELVSALLQKETGKTFANLIVTNTIPPLIQNPSPGHTMVSCAVLLKTLYTANLKTHCGKMKEVA